MVGADLLLLSLTLLSLSLTSLLCARFKKPAKDPEPAPIQDPASGTGEKKADGADGTEAAGGMTPTPQPDLEAPELVKNEGRFNAASVNFSNFQDLRGSVTPVINGRASTAMVLPNMAKGGPDDLGADMDDKEEKKKKKKKKKDKKKKHKKQKAPKEGTPPVEESASDDAPTQAKSDGLPSLPDREDSAGDMEESEPPLPVRESTQTTAEMKKVKKFGVAILPEAELKKRKKKKKKHRKSKAPEGAEPAESSGAEMAPPMESGDEEIAVNQL